jgi:aspartyl-tRNA(Asn)/glutamyl-tRNA(Gln) amidotransferase subunit A
VDGAGWGGSGLGPIAQLRARLAARELTPRQAAAEALQKANTNSGRNVYLARDEEWSLSEAERAEARFGARAPGESTPPSLCGLPVSLKDCFDLAGFVTTAGTKFYAQTNREATTDSAVAERLRAQGAVITGKTHLHPLAYGITGENRDFGDCTQPADAGLLTGGSTSGGAASVQEESAVAAIGTDTGGSIRVPAALCGLAGYRASIELAWQRGLWRGGVHLSQTFDTLGWIFRDVRDGPLLAEGLFGLKVATWSDARVKIGAIADRFLHDCDAVVRDAFEKCKERLAGLGEGGQRGLMVEMRAFDPTGWDDAMSIYAPIQASEAAAIHREATGGDYSVFPEPLGERLAWGASLPSGEIERQRGRHAEFRERVDALLCEHDFLLLPCSPMSRLEAGKDHSETRMKILRYTVPLSLAGTPVVTLPFAGGAGMQLVAARGEDAKLLAFASVVWPLVA